MGAFMGETRSATHAQSWVQGELLGDAQGVGARQAWPTPRQGGGGYLDGCTPSELRHRARKKFAKPGSTTSQIQDPREAALIGELDTMGMPGWFLEIARSIGFDNTMAMWRILDAQRELQADEGLMINLQMRPFASYQRFQRNRFIEALGAMGLSVADIRAIVKRDLGEDLSKRHILRLAGQRRVAA